MQRSNMLGIGAASAISGVVILVIMLLVGVMSQDALNAISHPTTPHALKEAISAKGNILVLLMAIDNIFLIAYTGAFLGAIAFVWERVRFVSLIALVLVILLALLDITENAITVSIVNTMQSGVTIIPEQLSSLNTLSIVKYSVSSLVVALLGIGILLMLPRNFRSLIPIALFFLYPIINSIVLVHPSLEVLRILWMLLMLLGLAYILWSNTPLLNSAE